MPFTLPKPAVPFTLPEWPPVHEPFTCDELPLTQAMLDMCINTPPINPTQPNENHT